MLVTATPEVVKGTTQVATESVSKVMDFDGADDFIEFNQALSQVQNAITIEFLSKGSSNLPKNTTLFEGFNSNNQTTLNIHISWTDGSIYWDAGNQNGNDRISKQAGPNQYKDKWSHWAFVKNFSTGQMAIYHNGTLWHQVSGKSKPLSGTQKFAIGAALNRNEKWSGYLTEFRIWNKACSQTEIKANSNKRLTGKEVGLILCLPLDNIQSGKVVDLTGNFQGTVSGNPSLINDLTCPLSGGKYLIDTLPLNQGMSTIGSDSMVSSMEYSTYDVDPVNRQKLAMMRRMFAYPTTGGVEVFTDKRVESLELIWIGNAQFKPTLLGYIEGAPPVPSENMNLDSAYQYIGATSVQLTTTEDVQYSWNRSQDTGLGRKR